MSEWLLLPPVAFFLLLVVGFLMSAFSKALAYKTENNPPGKTKSYACGQDVPFPHLQPDYNEFFPFAYFFTIMHVVALITATVPSSGGLQATGLALLYLVAAVSGLWILFRK